MRGRTTRRGSIAAVAVLGVLTAVAGMPGNATAAETQHLQICANDSCEKVALPDGLPNLAQGGRQAMEQICDALPDVNPVVTPDALVVLCLRELGSTYPVFVLAGTPDGGVAGVALGGGPREEICPYQGARDSVAAVVVAPGAGGVGTVLISETPCP